MTEKIKIYELTVSKIRCTGCAKKIKNGLGPLAGIKDVKVNVLAEKIIVTFDIKIINLEVIEKVLLQSNFKFVVPPEEIITCNKNVRSAQFLFLEQYYGNNKALVEQIVQQLQKTFNNGILEVSIRNHTPVKSKEKNDQRSNLQCGFLAQINYQSEILKARTIYDELQVIVEHQYPKEQNDAYQSLIAHEPGQSTFVVYDTILESFKNKVQFKDDIKMRDLFLAILLTIICIVGIMVLPLFHWFQDYLIYPQAAGVLSIYTIVGFVITILSMWKFGRKSYINAILNYKRHRLLNMDSLVSLGSFSSFIMSVLLMIVYSVQIAEESEEEEVEVDTMKRHEQIMNIAHMFESTSLILTVITIGKFFEGKAKKTILLMQQKIFPSDQLIKTTHYTYIEPKNQKLDIEYSRTYEVSLLEKGDIIKLNDGMKLLCDGVILKGSIKAVDSICYGQDESFMANPGMRLKSGADILEGECYFQIESTIEYSMLFQIAKQLDVAQSSSQVQESGISALYQTLSDHFVKGVMIVALSVLIVWLFLVGFEVVKIDQFCRWCFPFERSISLLVASCPCALGLAVPSVVAITLNLALQEGILVKKNTIFETIAKVKHVLFDKTGTLFTKIDKINSYDRLKVQFLQQSKSNQQQDQKEIETIEDRDVCPNTEKQNQNLFLKQDQQKQFQPIPVDKHIDEQQQINELNELGDEDIWGIVAQVEKNYKHPLAQLLFKEAINRSMQRKATFIVQAGTQKQQSNGIIGQVIRTDKQQQPLSVMIGNSRLMNENNAMIDYETEERIKYLEQRGKTVILLALNGNLIFLIRLDNKSNLRPEAYYVAKYIQQVLKKEVYILSGDSKGTVQDVGQYLRIPESNLLGEMDASGKKELLKGLQSKKNEKTMMIGDGLNDILSLQEAGVGVSINAKSELNLLAADVIILNENLWKIVILFNLMNVANKVVYINLIWAFAYNIIMAPVAAGALYPFGITISPMISSAAMSFSSIVVVLISNTLRFFTFDPTAKKSDKIFESNVDHNLNVTNGTITSKLNLSADIEKL